MSRKSWQLSRRTFLRGLGVSCALPYLEGMSWAGSAPREELARRQCFVYFPNGAGLPEEDDPDYGQWRWFPHGESREYRFTQVLASLEPFRDRLSVLGGLSHPRSRFLMGHIAGDTWLTGGDLRGDVYNNNISIDQVAAYRLKALTRYPSLVASVDGGVGYKSRVSTLSFDFNGKPVPSEHRLREIFERYFSPNGKGKTEERRRSLQQGKKIVDLVQEDGKRLQGRLSEDDRRKLDEYLESLNSVEEQIRRNEAWLDVPIKEFDAEKVVLDPDPAVDPTAWLRASYDLIVLAFQLDLTRVITFMTGREDGMGYGDNFPKLAVGIQRGHHTISHDTHKGHWEEWGKFDQWHARQFTYFLERMSKVADEHGPLLDSTQVLYGSCCSTTHNARNYPLILAGGSKLGLKHGAYTKFDEHEVPMSNLFVSMLNAGGIPTETFSDSTGRLPGSIFPA